MRATLTTLGLAAVIGLAAHAMLQGGRAEVLRWPSLPSLAVPPQPPAPTHGLRHALVTGGAGYIGSHAAKRLLREGWFVTVADDLSRGNRGAVAQLTRIASAEAAARQLPAPPLRFVQVDLAQRSAARDALRAADVPPEVVLHFAGNAYVAESVSDPLRYYINNAATTVNLLAEMAELNITKFVLSSTCALYGTPEVLPVTEKTPAKPSSPYGESKLWAERAVRDWAHAQPAARATILRYFNVYGCDPEGELGEWPRPALQHRFGRLSNMCLDAAAGAVPNVTVFGTQHPTADGTAVRDYIHVDDLVRAHVIAIPHLANPPALFNVAVGKGVSVKQVLDACRNVTGSNFTIVEHVHPRPGDAAAVYADNAEIVSKLGWRPRFSNMAEGLQHCWAWRQRTHHHGYGDKMFAEKAEAVVPVEASGAVFPHGAATKI